MNNFVEYIATNYTWIIGISIIILLAVIGYYADKTNFGQGKQEVPKDEDASTNEDIIPQKEAKEVETPELNTQKVVKEKSNEEFNKKYEEMSQEIEEFLPEKSLIDDDLLNEIDGLALDKKGSASLKSIPDLDDVELPSIKKFKSDKNIWKNKNK